MGVLIMTELLKSAAVGFRTGPAAAEILQSYIATGPAMIFNHTPVAAQTQKPKGPGSER